MADNFSSDNLIIRNFIIKCLEDEFPIIPEYINYDLFKKHMISKIFDHLEQSLCFKYKLLSNDWLFVFYSDKLYDGECFLECCKKAGFIIIPDEIIELYKKNVGEYEYE